MDAESNLAEVAVSSNNGSTSGEPTDPTVLKEKLADELRSAASLKGGGDGPALDVPLEKDDLLERLDKIDTDSSDAAAVKSSDGPALANDVDMENDDLIQRLEAMEKGEDETTAAKGAAPVAEEKKKDEVDGAPAQTNHQNGLEKENEADLLQEEGSKEKVAENMVVDDAKEEKKETVSSTEPTSNGASNEVEMEQPTSSVKRRHSQDEDSQITEPSTKKPHVEEEAVDAPKVVEPSEQKSEEKVEPEVKESAKENQADKESTEKPDESKSEEISVPETSVTDSVTKEDKEEKKPEGNLASSASLDSTKEEKKKEEILKDEKEVKESDESMEVAEPSDLSTKDENDTPVSEQKEVVVESSQEQKPTDESASSSCIDPTKEEKIEEETCKEEKDVKESGEPMEAAEPSEPGKDESNVAVSEQKKEVDSTPAMEQTADSSEAVAEQKSDSVEAESKLHAESSEAEKEAVETEPKVEEKVDDVTEEKPSEEKVEESAGELQEPASPQKVEDVKEPKETKPEDQEPAPSEPVEDVPKPSEADKAKPESLPELPAAEAEAEPTALPDTEPNTESSQEEQPTSSSPIVVEEKSDDAISSSSEKHQEQALPSSTEVDSAAAPEQPTEEPCEAETVTSSDEKPPTESPVPQEVDSTPDVTQVVASEPANEDEAMEVDSESVAETSSKEEVSEPPCTKKQAYECTEDEVETEKASEATPQKAEVEVVPQSTPEAIPQQEPVQKAAEQEEEKMEVDSVAPTQSKPDPDVTESMNTTSEELIESMVKDDSSTAADSQSETAVTVSELNKNMDATENAAEDSKSDASKTMDDSIECSLPTSSSDKMADRLKQRLDLISNGSSTPNAAVSSSNVYNSTPIQKQFEISSENVSKISRNSVDHSHQTDEEHSTIAVLDQSSIADEKEAVVASTSGVSKAPTEVEKQLVTDTSDDMSIPIKEGSSMKTESSEVDSCTASSALNTADEINMYATNARKFNGISSTSGSELEDKSTITPTNVSTTDTPTTVINKLDLTPALTSEEILYEVSVWYDGTELQFLSIEKLEHKSPSSGATAGSTQDLTGIDSSKQSSNGSVGSLGPFPLPPARPAADSAMSHSSTTETSSGTSQLKSSLPKMKHTVRGAKALATLMIEEFTKIKRALSKDEEISDVEPETPMKTPKGRPTSVTKKVATPSARGQKRSRTDSDTTEEELPKSKQAAKQAKKGSPSVAAPETTETAEPTAKKEDEQCCLARWSDRKYYAGKVAGYKGDNKFMIVFEDGASKALSRDVIVFGDKDTLPIMGHSIHALTGGDTYEPGIVQELKRNESDEVVYSVEIATGIVEVTASDMYLTEEQAKYINKACKATEASDEKSTSMQSPQSSGRRGANTPVMQTPEEGSGAASAEKGSRSTRRRGADKPQTPVTPEAGYSGGVGKKGRRGRRLS